MTKKMRKKIFGLHNDGLSEEMVITIILQTMKAKTDNEKAVEILEFIKWSKEAKRNE